MSNYVRTALIIVLIAVFIIIFGVGTGSIFVVRHLQSTIEADMSVLPEISEKYISTDINMLKSDVETLALRFSNEGNPALGEFWERQEADFPLFQGLAVFDREKGRVDATGIAPAPTGIRNEECILRAFAGGKTLSTTWIGEDEQVWIYVSAPMGSQVLTATLSGVYFSDRLSGFTIWESGNIFIDDGDGYVVANIRPVWVRERYNFINMAKTDSRHTDAAAVVSRMIRGETGIGRCTIEGSDRIVAFRPLAGSIMGWSIGVAAPVAESPWQTCATA